MLEKAFGNVLEFILRPIGIRKEQISPDNAPLGNREIIQYTAQYLAPKQQVGFGYLCNKPL